MQHHLTELRRRRAAGDSGFTLIELLVVVVIIGILIAIAIPVYLNYQKGAKDKSAASDLRNAISVLEQCDSDNSTYPTSTPQKWTTAAAVNPCSGQTLNLSGGTLIKYVFAAGGAGGGSYIITGYNTGGSPKLYCYNSAVGGSVTSTATTGYTAGGTATTFGTFTPTAATNC